jgi:hypothetical protein
MTDHQPKSAQPSPSDAPTGEPSLGDDPLGYVLAQPGCQVLLHAGRRQPEWRSIRTLPSNLSADFG